MRWVRAAAVDEVPEDEALGVQVDGIPVALVKVDEEIFAVNDICTHEHEHLSGGFVEDCAIECPRHGALFDLRTGKVLALPATEDLPVYPVKVEGPDVLIGFED